MRLSRHIPLALVFATAAVLSFQPVSVPKCNAEKFRLFSSNTKKEENSDMGDQRTSKAKRKNENHKGCPFYGCPLHPIDVHYNTEEIKRALEELRSDKRLNVVAGDAARKLSTSATDRHVTLTLIGYKGGPPNSQINQDRALVVAPYSITEENDEAADKENQPSSRSNPTTSKSHTATSRSSPEVDEFLKMDRILVGAFDGHAPRGEIVSDYIATMLPHLLAQKLSSKAIATAGRTKFSTPQHIEITKAALIETFVELDRTAPAEKSGGCTATVILQQGSKVYIANAGDSRSFVVAYRPSTGNVTVAYISREDKPHLPDERARVEAAGGQVYIPARGTSRVVYHDTVTGAPTGLAMSRSIGDWEAGKMGVIPDPIVDVLDTQALVANILAEDASDEADLEAYQVDVVGDMVGQSSGYQGRVDDDVYLFACSATDGMMDYLAAPEISLVLARALFDDAGAHPVAAVEHLIFAAANAWQQSKQGRYRDDIAIAVATIRRPPGEKETETVPPL